MNVVCNERVCYERGLLHRRSRGGKGAMPSKKILENTVILCFERRFSKQDIVIRLISNILAPKRFGQATPLVCYECSLLRTGLL